MSGAMTLGHQHLDAVVQHLLARVAEDRLHAGVDQHHPAGAVDHGESVGRGFDHLPKALLGALQRGLSGLAGAHVDGTVTRWLMRPSSSRMGESIRSMETKLLPARRFAMSKRCVAPPAAPRPRRGFAPEPGVEVPPVAVPELASANIVQGDPGRLQRARFASSRVPSGPAGRRR